MPTNPLDPLAADARRLDEQHLARIKAHPGRAGMDDVVFLLGQVEELQKQLDYINDELPRVRARGYSRGGKVPR